jgi:high affinity Mn2+ porin
MLVMRPEPCARKIVMLKRYCNPALIVCLCGLPLLAQDPPAPVADSPERWNLYYQATSIGQHHGSFDSAYEGPLSLSSHPETEASLTTTLFFGLNFGDYTQLFFDPEIAGGRGFSNVDGLANPTNGELPRVAGATPKPYIARLFITHDFALGDEKESVESDANQLSGPRPLKRYTIAVGRFSLTDYFDNNRYTHDPRSQFMGWAVMYNGAWDYAADVRGYTWGWVHELHLRNWSFRYASAFEPKVANGSQFDRRILRDRGDQFEGEWRYTAFSHPGAIRALGYLNHTDSGTYSAALQLAAATNTTPSVNNVLRSGRLKYGFGISADQEIRKNIGVFMRLGWSDGNSQDFAFTAIDRLATGGVSVSGARWRRPDDTVGSEFTAAGISAVHALYLSRGGLDFLLGDGALNYAPEMTWESYYNAHVYKWFYAAIDAQYITNPAYNQDRGPLWVWSLRLHIEAGFVK